jgi:hypothetical protein
MAYAWFIHANDVVTGPFDTDTVRTKLQTGQVPSGSYIWWKGQREWIPISAWESQVDHIDAGRTPLGPLTENELIENLKSMISLARVRLWAVGMEKWTSLFEVPDVMDALGISRRENQRAPLMGTVAVTRSNEDPKGYVLRTAAISVGGMGVNGKHDLRSGDAVSLLIKSPEIPGNMHLRGEVAYVTANGYCGIRFMQIHAESQAMILAYVKKFNQDAAAQAA